VLESKRYGALEGLKEGFLDGLGGIPEAIVFVQEMRLLDRAKSGVYGQLKKEMWGETVTLLDTYKACEQKAQAEAQEQERRQAEEKRRVDDWDKGMSGGRSKL